MKRALVFLLLFGSLSLCPQKQALSQDLPSLSFSSYLQKVTQQNLDLAAARFGVPIARAQVEVAKVFPDPVLTGGIAQVDVSGQAAPFMSTLGVTIPIELGGKRRGRIAVAQAELSVAEAELIDSVRKLRAEAAGAYVTALTARLVLARKRKTLESLHRLVEVNQKRQQSGDIGEVALIQSRVESQRYQAEVLAAEAEEQAADLELFRFLGQSPPGMALRLEGNLQIPPQQFDQNALAQKARQLRPDLFAKRRSEELMQARQQLAGRNRMVDVSVSVGWQRSLYSEPFASPQYDALTAQLSLPLPFSRIYRGELLATQKAKQQAAVSYEAAVLRAEVEVRQSLLRYEATVAQLRLYTQGVLADADKVLASILYSYQRGSATLLEVLTAQRTVDDVYLAYLAAQGEHARQLIAVQQAAGLDVELTIPPIPTERSTPARPAQSALP